LLDDFLPNEGSKILNSFLFQMIKIMPIMVTKFWGAIPYDSINHCKALFLLGYIYIFGNISHF